jgi:hypothetical protein
MFHKSCQITTASLLLVGVGGDSATPSVASDGGGILHDHDSPALSATAANRSGGERRPVHRVFDRGEGNRPWDSSPLTIRIESILDPAGRKRVVKLNGVTRTAEIARRFGATRIDQPHPAQRSKFKISPISNLAKHR